MVCIDGGTGLVVWKTSITERADSGLVLSADLKASLASHVGLSDIPQPGKARYLSWGAVEL